MQDRSLDGRIYEDHKGACWLVGRKNRPDAPAEATNIDTGEIVIYEAHRVARWVEVRLRAVLRWLDNCSTSNPSTR